MSKLNVCVLFGGVSPEHEVSLRSAEAVLNNLDSEKYNIYPVGITKAGKWIYFAGTDYSLLPSGKWQSFSGNLPAVISPSSGQGLICVACDCVYYHQIDVVFPVLHGENGEDGSVQGLLQIAGIPCVGAGVAASAVGMDKTLTKLVLGDCGIQQAVWLLVRNSELNSKMDAILERIEKKFSYPVFVKPAGTGSSVGVSKAGSREALQEALIYAGQYGEKILVEEYICGYEVEVAVMGNDRPVASVCGEIESGTEFYDYDAKYITDTSIAYIPARISESTAELVRQTAIEAYTAIGCKGLARVDFFVTKADARVVLNEINTLPGFTSISMYPKLFAASGISYGQLLDSLITYALEAI